MALYTIRFHSPNGTVIDQYEFELWCGNRANTNLGAIAAAQTFYSALAYNDEGSRSALWGCLGLDADKKADELLNLPVNWKDCAVTMRYPHNGRVLIAVFTLNRELGECLYPGKDVRVTSADEGFKVAFEMARKAV